MEKSKKCNICGDEDSIRNTGTSNFCINQHCTDSGEEMQPRSVGSTMYGKTWAQTPEEKKKKK